jgi:two-component system, LytTR family, sensor kinase
MFGNQGKNKIYWALQVGGWSFYAFLHIMLLFIDNQENVRLLSILMIIFTAAYFLVSSHVYRQIIISLGWLNKNLLSLIPRVLISTILLGFTWYIFELALSYVLGTLDPMLDFQLFRILAFVIAAMAWYLLWAAVYLLYHYVEKTNNSLKYEAAVYEIELNQLKSQLNPHFIFNALNSIRALIDEDPVKSKTAVTQLSNILRNSLISNRRKLVELKDEINTVRDYLALESIRFEERLKVGIEVDPAVSSFQVPPLMIQTLVENGIKHGISKLTLGGKISVHAYLNTDNQLQIDIRNSGQLVQQENKNESGYGLENTRRRLNLLFDNKAFFSVENENTNTVLTKIMIPQTVVYESINN